MFDGGNDSISAFLCHRSEGRLQSRDSKSSVILFNFH